MFKSLHTRSLNQFLFGKFKSSNRPSISPSPPRSSPRRPQLLIDTIPTEILLEIFLFVVSSALSDHESCSECRRRRHSGSEMLLTHPPSMILSHVCKRWREIMLESPLLWSFISNQDFFCKEWINILLYRLWRIIPQPGPLLHPNDTPLLTIRFRICPVQSRKQIRRQMSFLQFLVHRSSSRIRDLSVNIVNHEMFTQVCERDWEGDQVLTNDYVWGKQEVPIQWTENLEELSISQAIQCGDVESNYTYEKWAVDIKKGEVKEEQYISYLTFRHTPPLLFSSKGLSEPVFIFGDGYNDEDDDETMEPEPELRSRLSHLRKLSLRDCYLPLQQHLYLRNVEELTAINAEPIWVPSTVLYWKSVFHSLPRLRRLSIEQALIWCDWGILPLWREWHPSFENPSTNLEELNVNRCTPLGAAMILQFFTNSQGVVDDQQQRKQSPRKLQITCTNVNYDKGFRELCKAVRAWFNSWSSWNYGSGGGYLYLSIGPSSIVVHNRRVNITEISEVTKSATNEEEPEIQLTLYSNNILKLDLISDMLHLILSSPLNEFDATDGPFTLSREELELSVGLFYIEDDGLARVLTSFLETFGKAKTLRKLRCVGSTTARVLLSRESGGLTLLPILQTVHFDHVDFSDLEVIREMSNPPTRVELIKCQNVRRDWVSKLQHVGTDVLLGRGTSIVEESEGSSKQSNVLQTTPSASNSSD